MIGFGLIINGRLTGSSKHAVELKLPKKAAAETRDKHQPQADFAGEAHRTGQPPATWSQCYMVFCLYICV